MRYWIGPCFITLLFLSSTALHGNGYNNISSIAIPVLFIIAGLLYLFGAFVPALLVYCTGNRVLKEGGRAGFGLVYLGSLIGGEAGIFFSWFIWRYLEDKTEWSSYYYTLYPYLIIGLSLLAGIGAYVFSYRRKTAKTD